jgi:hypothetical protein
MDELYRQLLGWPVPPVPKTEAEIVADLRLMVRERVASRERRRANPLPGTKLKERS